MDANTTNDATAINRAIVDCMTQRGTTWTEEKLNKIYGIAIALASALNDIAMQNQDEPDQMDDRDEPDAGPDPGPYELE